MRPAAALVRGKCAASAASAAGAGAALLLAAAVAQAQPAAMPVASEPSPAVAAALALQSLPRPSVPPPERGEVLPSQVLRWRQEAQSYEHGEGVSRDAVRAAELYCRAARHGDAEAQFSLAWMQTHARGIERNDASAAHLFTAAAEQGHVQARNMAARLGTPQGPPPPCLRPPEADAAAAAPAPAAAEPTPPSEPGAPRLAPIPQALLERAPIQIVSYVQLVAPEYRLDPALVLAVIAAESNFDPAAVSPKNAHGLMQLLPETGRRFGVRNVGDPAQNIRGGMAYLRWLLAYFGGDIALALAGYNAGENAVERYLGVPPFGETRNYVIKIMTMLGGRRSHAFDANIVAPSARLALMRGLFGGPSAAAAAGSTGVRR